MKTESVGNITLINGDCMEYMKTLLDKYFNLAIVDPLYGNAMQGDREIRNERGRFDKYKSTSVVRTGGTWASKYGTTIREWDIAPSEEYFKELFRVSENQIIWGANYFSLPPSRCFVIWDKTQPENFTMAMAEYAWTSFNANAKIFRCRPNGLPGERFHPTQKPIKLYRWLLSHYAKEGDRILDTHGGSMSSMVACYEEGFQASCVEISPEYFEKGVVRLREYAKQQKIF